MAWVPAPLPTAPLLGRPPTEIDLTGIFESSVLVLTGGGYGFNGILVDGEIGGIYTTSHGGAGAFFFVPKILYRIMLL